ncbi:MAG: GAF domain-containing protein [Candidatus Omnitrophica bacterium]|nr:GAF domain-containing protein [Candidatus Omnitrophota bacterium]
MQPILKEQKILVRINSVCTSALSAESVKELLEGSLKDILELFRASRGSIFLLEPGSDHLVLQACQGLARDEQIKISKRLGEGVMGRVAQSKTPILVEDISNDKRFANFKSRRSYQSPSFICSPLMTKDKLIGVINISDKTSRKKFNRNELKVLDFLSSQIALNYERLMLKNQLGLTNQEAARLKKEVVLHERLASLGKLAGGIAHEFNNPLDGVIRYTNLSLEHLDENNEVVREYLLEARQGLKRMANIVKSLLDCARNTASSTTQVDVNFCIEQTLKELRSSFLHKNITVTRRLQEHLPPMTDRGLERIVFNIIRNAIDAIDGKGAIEIATSMQGAMLKIQVSDSGRGIPQQNIDKIFEPFFTTKGMEEGCGLGLTIVSEVVRLYDGKIQIESAPSKGTTFTVLLPLNP